MLMAIHTKPIVVGGGVFGEDNDAYHNSRVLALALVKY